MAPAINPSIPPVIRPLRKRRSNHTVLTSCALQRYQRPVLGYRKDLPTVIVLQETIPAKELSRTYLPHLPATPADRTGGSVMFGNQQPSRLRHNRTASIGPR